MLKVSFISHVNSVLHVPTLTSPSVRLSSCESQLQCKFGLESRFKQIYERRTLAHRRADDRRPTNDVGACN